MSNVIDLRETMERRFGVCPECHRTNGYLNIEGEHWFICQAHGYRWRAGVNIFSSWKCECEDIWQRNFEELRRYREVQPVYPREIAA